MNELENVRNVRLNEAGDKVLILDQEKLPNVEEYLELGNAEELYDAIFRLKVRGAPGYGMYVLAKQIETEDFDTFYKEWKEKKDYLDSSRPTAVNLSWALNRMEKVVLNHREQSVAEIKELLLAESRMIQAEDVQMCKAISEHGLSLLKDGDGVLTHCNAGPLATSKYGTALGPLMLGKERGMEFHVFADETRPLLQGARLTAYELQKAGVDVTLICDNMAGLVMKNGWVDALRQTEMRRIRSEQAWWRFWRSIIIFRFMYWGPRLRSICIVRQGKISLLNYVIRKKSGAGSMRNRRRWRK